MLDLQSEQSSTGKEILLTNTEGRAHPANIYVFKVNSRNTRKNCEMWNLLCSKYLFEQRHSFFECFFN